MPRAEVTIKTHDGNCPASVFTPAKKDGAERHWTALFKLFQETLTVAQ